MIDDIHEIESMLSRHRPAAPNADLRVRILHQTRQRRASYWSFLEAMAALLLIGLNLAQIRASVTQFIPPPDTDQARTQQIAAEINRLELPIAPDEAQAMAQRLVSGNRLVLVPLIHGPATLDLNTGAIP